MKKFDAENKSLEAQARRLVAYFDELFFANLQKKHPTEELEGELPARAMRAIVILSNRGRCIMSDFANAVGVPVSTATHMIEKLVRKGLVVRVRSEEDRRVVYVELSDEGRKRERPLPAKPSRHGTRYAGASQPWRTGALPGDAGQNDSGNQFGVEASLQLKRYLIFCGY